ncbi:MAG: GNAT family N-acetyltransferase [Patescibacteria group bacterium]|nr:GNAT family N-acetyltransferase [Patescibacteria group bacterium]
MTTTTNSEVSIREYEDRDAAAVAELLARLQDFIAQIDQLKQYVPYEEFDKEKYFQMQFKTVQEKSGRILVAESDGAVVGAIAGFFKNEDCDEQVECYRRRRAYVSDLLVAEAHRGKGVGERLMAAMEEYFRSQKCDYIALTCMAANGDAHRFYERHGYEDYSVRMVKKLK